MTGGPERRNNRDWWEHGAEWPLTVAALLFLTAYAYPILNPELSEGHWPSVNGPNEPPGSSTGYARNGSKPRTEIGEARDSVPSGIRPVTTIPRSGVLASANVFKDTPTVWYRVR